MTYLGAGIQIVVHAVTSKCLCDNHTLKGLANNIARTSAILVLILKLARGSFSEVTTSKA